MLDKLKELNQMRQQAKQLQQMLAEEVITVEKGNVKVRIRGDQKIEMVEINGQEEDDLKDALNEAIKESQKAAAKKMQGSMGDFKIPGF